MQGDSGDVWLVRRVNDKAVGQLDCFDVDQLNDLGCSISASSGLCGQERSLGNRASPRTFVHCCHEKGTCYRDVFEQTALLNTLGITSEDDFRSNVSVARIIIASQGPDDILCYCSHCSGGRLGKDLMSTWRARTDGRLPCSGC